MKGYRSLVQGSPPTIVPCPSFDKEVDAIVKFVTSGDPREACLVARTKDLVEQYAAAVKARDLQVHLLSRGKADDHSAAGLRVATMHRVKGLEFDRVVVAGVNDGIVPLSVALSSTDDPAVREDMERQERALLYVALTRARREAMITCFDTPSSWIRQSSK
jgi:superfamily I DNA/RNA helicase